MRLSAWTATATSAARRLSVCARNSSPITCFHRPMVASARARVLYLDALCHAIRPSDSKWLLRGMGFVLA